MASESARRTILVALGVCLVCSVLVSGSVVILRQRQQDNKELDKLKNILQAANLYTDDAAVKKTFQEKIRPQLVDLTSGQVLNEKTADKRLDPARFDLKAIARDPELSRAIPTDKDLAHIGRQPNYMVVYNVVDDGQISALILPVYGKGLWSTMYGFIALKSDLQTVSGFIFYGHGETPGLGGEVDNPLWRAKWVGKQAFDDSGVLKIEVIKGKVDPVSPLARYQIDGLSGATLTTRGVDHLVKFWLGANGYEPLLNNLRAKVVAHE
jgi:Na+-transporting NADH:ubiquinone oxidoreductase subunit C